MKLRIAVGAVVMIGVLAVAWVFGVQPQLAAADQDAQNRATYEQLTAVYQNRLRSLATDRQNLPALEARLAAAEAYIPTSPSLGDFLTELNELETKFGVHVTAYQASDPVATVTSATTTAGTASTTATGSPAASGTAGSGATATTSGTASSGLYEIPVQVQVQGPYDKIVDFTGALEKGSRLFIGTKVAIGASPTGAGFAGTVSGDLFVVTPVG
jgi:Tfp pilus assembly protein PilO